MTQQPAQRFENNNYKQRKWNCFYDAITKLMYSRYAWEISKRKGYVSLNCRYDNIYKL